jgi:integrase
MFDYARHTGLRYSSVARLKWADVDLDKGLIRHTPPKTARHAIEVLIPLARPWRRRSRGRRQWRQAKRRQLFHA